MDALKPLLVLGYPALVIAFDVWLKATGRKTISTVIQEQAIKRPIIAFGFGSVFGGLAVHFFPF